MCIFVLLRERASSYLKLASVFNRNSIMFLRYSYRGNLSELCILLIYAHFLWKGKSFKARVRYSVIE